MENKTAHLKKSGSCDLFQGYNHVVNTCNDLKPVE